MVACWSLIYFRYDYEDPSFETVKYFAKLILSGQGPLSPINCFPAWFVKFVSWKVSITEPRHEKTCLCHMRTTDALLRCLASIIPLIAIAEISRP